MRPALDASPVVEHVRRDGQMVALRSSCEYSQEQPVHLALAIHQAPVLPNEPLDASYLLTKARRLWDVAVAHNQVYRGAALNALTYVAGRV